MKKKLIIMLFLLIMPVVVFAEDCRPNGISLKSIELSEKGGLAEEIVKANIAFGKINLNLKLDEVGDYVQYKIVVNNTTNNDYELSKLDGSSGYVKYEFFDADNSNVLKAGESKTVYLRVSYDKKVPDSSLINGQYIDSKKLMLTMASNDGINNGNSNINNNVVTGNNAFIVTIIILLLSSIFSIFSLKRVRLGKKMLIISLCILMPIGVSAVCYYDFVIESNVLIGSGENNSEYYVYTNNKSESLTCKINSPIPENIVTYDNVFAANANPVLRHKIVNNNIQETSVGIYSSILNNYIYLIGGGATFNAEANVYNADSPYYLQNKLKLIALYGNTCSETDDNGYKVFKCHWVSVRNDGYIWAQLDCRNGCTITPDGTSYCDAIRC